MGSLRVGIDIGGTFTDLAMLEEETGRWITVKLPTTPDDPTAGVLNCLREAEQQGFSMQEVSFLCHGTTIATNTLIERKGAKTWLALTKGFRGINDIMDYRAKHSGYEPYSIKPQLLVPQRRTIELDERVGSSGQVIKPLEPSELEHTAKALIEGQAESLAACLLFSFMNAQHEEAMRDYLMSKIPKLHVSISCEVLPQIREFVRMSTTVVDAYIAPRVKDYMLKLEAMLTKLGIACRPYVMQSNGGMLTLGVASRRPVNLVESGPAAGAIISSHIGRLLGLSNILYYDMGGTTAKAGLILNGSPLTVNTCKASGLPLGVPSIDLVEVGSGGGSIAWIDPIGLLKVGPRSAGASPGPACYGKGGEEPTVTDANLVLGYIDPEYFLGGRLKLDVGSAEEAIGRKVAEPLGMSIIEASIGILKVVNANMAETMRLVSVFRGHDPRDLALFAFGGAGPIHGPTLARELGIGKVIIPPKPGIASAIGLLLTDLSRDHVLSKVSLLSQTSSLEIEAVFGHLEDSARRELINEGFRIEDIEVTRLLDLRYSGQAYEITIEAPRTELREDSKAAIRAKFDDEHERLYGSRASMEPVQIVSYRLKALVKIPKPTIQGQSERGADPRRALKGHRRAFFVESDGFLDVPVFSRDSLECGNRISGPAIVEQLDATTIVNPSQSAMVDGFQNLVIS